MKLILLTYPYVKKKKLWSNQGRKLYYANKRKPTEATIMVGKIEEIHIGDRKEKERDIKELENDELIESLHEKFNIPKDNIKVFIYEEGEKDG